MKVNRALVLVCVTAAVVGCAKPRPRAQLTMPHPEGCYVEVFDAPNFSGSHDFINGPAKHATMSNLPGGADWRRRVRSLKAGPAATVLGWAAEDFAGVSVRFRPEQQAPSFPDSFDAKIESIRIDCKAPAQGPGANF
jgi:hypothetical protein